MKAKKLFKCLTVSVLMGTLFSGCKGTASVRNFHSNLFGKNTYIFSAKDNPAKVQKVLEELYEKQEKAQFGNERFALYFMPGEYDSSIFVHVGFYMQVAGLGQKPTDTKISRLDCLARWLGNNPLNHNACCNFWRGLENIEIGSDTVWAVSQATYLRRVKIDGTVSFHDDGGWCSGGFSSNCIFDGESDSGSQQQWLSRNNNYEHWNNASWNMVMCGDSMNQPLSGQWPETPYTVIEKTPVIREKPFLTFDNKKGYGVFVPELKKDSVGADWHDGSEKGSFIPIKKFYIAKPGDSAKKINKALNKGKHLFFTPGIYNITEPILVKNKNTVVLGSGLPTLIPVKGTEVMIVSDEEGIIVSGILFDASPVKGKNMLLVGSEKNNVNHQENPIILSDLFFRIGGTETELPVKTETCITINSNNVIGDNFWIWRADHGAQVGWELNEAETGIIINGDNVTMYALMVEHFNKHETVWNGNGGRLYMYQCEIPYDVPSQEAWMSHNNTKEGYASIVVAENVTDFEGTGIGIYLLNRKAEVNLESPVEVPDCEGVSLNHIVGVMIGGHPGMAHLVNDKGPSFTKGFSKKILTGYCNKNAW